MDFIPAYKTMPGGHECELPFNYGGYGSTGYKYGDLIKCDECGQWWYSAPCYESLGPVSWWAKVRWYHFNKLDAIKRYEDGNE